MCLISLATLQKYALCTILRPTNDDTKRDKVQRPSLTPEFHELNDKQHKCSSNSHSRISIFVTNIYQFSNVPELVDFIESIAESTGDQSGAEKKVVRNIGCHAPMRVAVVT